MLKKALRKGVKVVKDQVKSSAPRQSGALATSISTKVAGRKLTAYAVAGPRIRYSKKVKNVEKIPNLYAKKIDDQQKFLTATFDTHKQEYIDVVNEVIVTEVQKALQK